MRYLCLFIFIFAFSESFATKIDTIRIEKQAMLIVHVEHYDFDVEGNIEDIFSKYEVKYLVHKGLHSSIFFLIKESNQEDGCEYILAYDGSYFFRLKGFKTSDFNIFYRFMVLENHTLPHAYPSKKEIMHSIYIEKYNLEENYNLYYKKSKYRAFDPTSCFKISIMYDGSSVETAVSPANNAIKSKKRVEYLDK